MIFESRDFYIHLVESNDLNEVMEVYNSNVNFLINHMDKKHITTEWIAEEISSMSKEGFYSYKIIEKNSGKIIGIIDLKVDEETYLSLLMLHSDYKNLGLGKQIFKTLEGYVQSLGSKFIRIDVVTNYDNTVLDFWIYNGFIKDKDVTLEWAGKTLPAVVMRKSLELLG